MRETIPWARVLTEGVVIIVSILLALGADASWEQRQERLDEQDALRGLDEDFRRNLDELENVIGMHDWSRQMVGQLWSMSDSELTAVPEDSAAMYANALLTPRSFEVRDGTLDALIASGRLGMISDPQLRDLLVEWKSLVEDLEEEAQGLMGSTSSYLYRAARLGGPWRLATGDGAPLVGLADETSNLPDIDLRAAANDAELMSFARTKQFWAAVYLRELKTSPSTVTTS